MPPHLCQLLNAIAGELVQSKGLALEGNLLVDGALAPSARAGGARPAYVQQADLFYAQVSCRHANSNVLPLSVSREEGRFFKPRGGDGPLLLF